LMRFLDDLRQLKAHAVLLTVSRRWHATLATNERALRGNRSTRRGSTVEMRVCPLTAAVRGRALCGRGSCALRALWPSTQARC